MVKVKHWITGFKEWSVLSLRATAWRKAAVPGKGKSGLLSMGWNVYMSDRAAWCLLSPAQTTRLFVGNETPSQDHGEGWTTRAAWDVPMVVLGVLQNLDPWEGCAWWAATGDVLLVLVKKPVWSTIRVLRHGLLLCVIGVIWSQPSSRRRSVTWRIIIEPQVPDLFATFGFGFWMCSHPKTNPGRNQNHYRDCRGTTIGLRVELLV